MFVVEGSTTIIHLQRTIKSEEYKMTNSLNEFFIDCLDLKYHSNSQDNPLHEKEVEKLLKKHNLKYEYQPNGTHQSPDFRVHHNGKTYDIECKSSKQAHPTYNGGLPKEGVVYVFSSKKYNETTVFFADDVVSKEKRALYSKLIVELNDTLKQYQQLNEWVEDERGFDFYVRNMFTQSGGKDKTDYFTHPRRGFCEDRVVNYAF
jgi:nitrous oxide reductase